MQTYKLLIAFKKHRLETFLAPFCSVPHGMTDPGIPLKWQITAIDVPLPAPNLSLGSFTSAFKQ